MFDRKAQSALEYLMTYGWALIVIAIVIGVLIFVTSGATGGVTCQSQSTSIQVTEQAVTQNTVGLTLRNATGGTIAINSATGSNGFGNGTPVYGGIDLNTTSNVVSRNGSFTVSGLAGTGKAGTFQNATVTIDYNTQGGLNAAATIVCSGTV
jgi:hypothetical protein